MIIPDRIWWIYLSITTDIRDVSHPSFHYMQAIIRTLKRYSCESIRNFRFARHSPRESIKPDVLNDTRRIYAAAYMLISRGLYHRKQIVDVEPLRKSDKHQAEKRQEITNNASFNASRRTQYCVSMSD